MFSSYFENIDYSWLMLKLTLKLLMEKRSINVINHLLNGECL